MDVHNFIYFTNRYFQKNKYKERHCNNWVLVTNLTFFAQCFLKISYWTTKKKSREVERETWQLVLPNVQRKNICIEMQNKTKRWAAKENMTGKRRRRWVRRKRRRRICLHFIWHQLTLIVKCSMGTSIVRGHLNPVFTMWLEEAQPEDTYMFRFHYGCWIESFSGLIIYILQPLLDLSVMLWIQGKYLETIYIGQEN